MKFISRIRLSEEPSVGSLLSVIGGASSPWRADRRHAMIWSLFGDTADRKRDFLYRMDWKRKRPEFLVVSNREPIDRHNLFEIESKPFCPDLRTGDRLRVMGRVNPVVRKDIDGKRKKIDVVMDALWQRRDEESGADQGIEGESNRIDIAQDALFRWFSFQGSRRCGFGFAVHEFHTRSYDFETFWHKGETAAKPLDEDRGERGRITFGWAEIEAEIEVLEPEKTLAMLYEGIGSGRSYGYGLMLARRCSGGEGED